MQCTTPKYHKSLDTLSTTASSGLGWCTLEATPMVVSYPYGEKTQCELRRNEVHLISDGDYLVFLIIPKAKMLNTLIGKSSLILMGMPCNDLPAGLMLSH